MTRLNPLLDRTVNRFSKKFHHVDCLPWSDRTALCFLALSSATGSQPPYKFYYIEREKRLPPPPRSPGRICFDLLNRAITSRINLASGKDGAGINHRPVIGGLTEAAWESEAALRDRFVASKARTAR